MFTKLGTVGHTLSTHKAESGRFEFWASLIYDSKFQANQGYMGRRAERGGTSHKNRTKQSLTTSNT